MFLKNQKQGIMQELSQTTRKNIIDMKKIHVILIVLMLSLAAKVGRAQQDPMFTQYNFNLQTINAAYAGTWDNLGFLALGRFQWITMDGAPTTYTLSVQSPIRGENMAWGLNVIADKIGREKRLTFAGDYSYRIHITDKTNFRLGLKVGVTNYSNPLTDYTQYPGQADSYTGDVDVKFLPNFGVGAFLSSDRYYVGLSVPKIIQNDVKYSDGSYSSFSEMRHFFLIGGYVFNLSENLKFKPTGLVKGTIGSPIQFDLTANFLIKERIWLGAMYRWGDSFGFIAQFVFDEHVRIGYAIDFTTTEIRNYHNGTHELMISYELGMRKKWKTPRMF